MTISTIPSSGLWGAIASLFNGNFTDINTRAKIVEGVTPLAPAGGRFISDGSGGGEFIRIQGWAQYADTDVVVGTPSQTLVSGVRTQLTIDGGALTLEKLPSDTTNPLWNVTTNLVQPIALFDTYNVRVEFHAENYSGPTPYLLLELDIGGVLGAIWSRTIPLLRGGSEQNLAESFPVFAGSTFLSNGGKFFMTYVGGADCDIFKSQVLIIRESKNYV